MRDLDEIEREVDLQLKETEGDDEYGILKNIEVGSKHILSLVELYTKKWCCCFSESSSTVSLPFTGPSLLLTCEVGCLPQLPLNAFSCS